MDVDDGSMSLTTILVITGTKYSRVLKLMCNVRMIPQDALERLTYNLLGVELAITAH